MITNALGPITLGKDYNYYKLLNVSAGSFATDADVVITFQHNYLSFQVQSGSVSYSFNGNTLHGTAAAGLPSQSLLFHQRPVSKIWFAGTGVVRIEAF
jgi:hypothetical protein